MNSDFTVIRADGSHLGDIYEIEQLCFSEPWSLKSLYEDICENKRIYFVAQRDGRVVGYAGMWTILDEAHIMNIAVHPDHRTLGCGKRLLSSLIDAAIQLGSGSMTLEVRVSNEPALALYQGADFVIAGRRKNYYQKDGEDAYIMWKELGKQG